VRATVPYCKGTWLGTGTSPGGTPAGDGVTPKQSGSFTKKNSTIKKG